jgi:hypothetical protein
MPKPISPNGTASPLSRRHFIKYTTLATTAFGVAPAFVRGQNLNSLVDVAVIGAGGKGASDTDETAKVGGNIVALCDVDSNTLNSRGAKYPKAKLHRDYRKMLDELEKSVDAVIVATPDHLHAPASVMAMKMGKHCFCQKPLTHSVFEARTMRDVAKSKKVATQMGNQGSAGTGLRRAVEVIQAGVIGKPQQLHVWSNRPIWPQGMGRPEGSDPVPDNPTEIEAESTGMNTESYPFSSKIRFQFPEREGLPPLTFHWYDGKPDGKETFRPHADLTEDIVAKQGKLPGSGCLIIGDKGRIFSPDDYGSQFFIRMNDEKALKPSKEHEALGAIPESIPRSPGHYQEWMDAIKGGRPGYSNFDIAAYLTEIILLGCVALRVGKKLEWDGPKMKAKNAPEAAQYVKRQYRKGWKLG